MHRHTSAPLQKFSDTSTRFDHVHLDIIGPLPPSTGFTYCLTTIDRFSRWTEATPLPDIQVTITEAFYSNWIARFDVLSIIQIKDANSNRASSGLFPDGGTNTRDCVPPSKQCVVSLTTKVSNYVPRSTSAELVYGKTLRLLGEFFDNTQEDSDPAQFVITCRYLDQNRPARQVVFVHKDLKTCTHVFVRRNSVRRPLQSTYDRPFLELKRSDKFFKTYVNGKPSIISIDRVKPAFMPNTDSYITPRATKLSPDTLAKTTLRQTRSSRHVNFLDYFVSSR
ncbi:pol polyprotein [Nephila pilipes]|uniref:Pol polyprotein n=1 Tax=Nephila pilipes TaxID=299642 RepID=A0A8X6NKD8_NEPPI|nr:pol polyprotein [Nephila pilipes]